MLDEQQLYCFLLNGEIDKEYNITSENVIIENGNYVDSSFLANFIEKSGKSDIQILDYFKQNTLLFKEKDYVNFFNNGIEKHNLKNIGFQTTAQDTVQVSSVKKVIEYVMSRHKDKTLNVYIKTYFLL